MSRNSGTMMFEIITILLGSGLLSDALPMCEFTGEKFLDLVCTPGTTDFVLERGLVSDNRRATSISLRGCRVIGIENNSFTRLPSLESLDLSQNKLKEVKLGVLDEFQQLLSLNLSCNQITGFENGLFDQKPNLEVLDVSRNNINYLQLGVLDGFRLLKVFNMSDNQLTGIPLGLFDQKPNLEYLILSGNRINNLDLGVLDPLKKLKHVDISRNPLVGKNLSPWLFDRSPHIEYIDFSSINMTETPNNMLHAFRALRFLALEGCSLTRVPPFATKPNLNTMTHLVLSRNAITAINNPYTFEELINLEVINLGKNYLESIPDGLFAPLPKLKEVVLSNNRLKQLPDLPLFQSLPFLTSVDLSYNSIKTITITTFKGSTIKHLNFTNNSFTYLPENFIFQLNQLGTVITNLYIDKNPWQCACLLEILNEAKDYGIIYDSTSYNGDVPVCVTEREFKCKRGVDNNKYYTDLYENLLGPV